MKNIIIRLNFKLRTFLSDLSDKDFIYLIFSQLFLGTLSFILSIDVANNVGLVTFASIGTGFSAISLVSGLAGFAYPESLQHSVGQKIVELPPFPIFSCLVFSVLLSVVAKTTMVFGTELGFYDVFVIALSIPSFVLIETASRVAYQLGNTKVSIGYSVLPNSLIWVALCILARTGTNGSYVMYIGMFYIVISLCALLYLASLNVLKFKFLDLQFRGLAYKAYCSRLLAHLLDFLPFYILQTKGLSNVLGLYTYFGRFYGPIVLLLNAATSVIQKSIFAHSTPHNVPIKSRAVSMGLISVLLTPIIAMVYISYTERIAAVHELIDGHGSIILLIGLLAYKSVYTIGKLALDSNLTVLNNQLLGMSVLMVAATYIFASMMNERLHSFWFALLMDITIAAVGLALRYGIKLKNV